MSMTMDKNGKTVKIGVNDKILAASPHAKKKCVDCHKGFDPNEMPHKAKIEPVDCKSCHNEVASKHKFHPKMVGNYNVTPMLNDCKNCHGKHDVVSPKNPKSKTHFSNSAEFCGNCHKEQLGLHIQSTHFKETNKHNPNAPSCVNCHRNPITPGWKVSEVQLKINQEQLCLDCHLNNENKSKYASRLVEFSKSIHATALRKGKKEAAGCIDCHGTHELQKAAEAGSRISPMNVPSLCGKCHIAISHEYESSVHGVSLKKGNIESPGCSYCHGEHNINAMPEVPPRVFEETHISHSTVVRNKMVYCVACHSDEEQMKKFGLQTVAKAHSWLPAQSAHWETVRCIDCHSSYVPPNLSHNILPPEKTIKKCEECHNKNSILMSKLYQHDKQASREKFGFINGTLLSNAYVIGSTKNVLMDSLSLIIFSVTIGGVFLHGFLRWYFTRGGKK
jgi:hypothetical protein